MKRTLTILAVLLSGALAFAGFQAVRQRTAAAPASMAAMLPQGALLTIESPDFAGLLHDWNVSPEQKAWLASDHYSVFSNSRLFGRLNDARTEFESAARSSPFDGDFLTQVAGRQSIFAWYDVGNLEFLYITRLPAGQAANIALLKQRAGWSARQAGGSTFYIRKTPAGSSAAGAAEAESAQGKARTVAFAQLSDAGGDLLVLATREDLIANALALMHPPANAQSVANEAWFTEASAAAAPAGSAPALHMVLNLERITPLPQFRSYWVQENITRMGEYRAAVTDLFREAGVFREERALLLKSTETETPQADLASLTALAPAGGVFRADATGDPAAAVTTLEEKLLGRITLAALPETDAPDPSLDAPQAGSTADYETRIDTPAPVSAAVSNQALAQTIKSAGLDAVLTWSSAQAPASAAGLWIPIHSAVVLHAGIAWNASTLQSALQQSLRGSLTASSLGIEFRPDTVNGQTSGQTSGQTIYALTGPKPLFFAVSGNTALFADDRAVLLSLLAPHPAAPSSARATELAGFDHASQRAPYARLTALIDGTNQVRPTPAEHVQPAYFSGTMRSLSDSFAALAGERFSERGDGAVVRQTVTYQWQGR